jgi:Leucine-rich repeat (LRR) protein
LRKDYFLSAGLNRLQFLNIEYNGIVDVEPGAFNGLPALTYLGAQNNNISGLQPGTFSNLINLKMLDLGYNRIQTLPFGAFLGLENLYYLILNANQIEEIHEDIFIGLSNLQSLWFDGNRISQLHPDVFKHIPKLTVISLRNNHLYLPTDRPFLNAPSLTRCILSGCNITNLSAKSFKMSPNLEYLDLEENHLETIDVEMLESLPGLKELHLFNNPLHCDCSLQQVWSWCRKYKIITGYGDEMPQCHSPDNVSGLSWGVLSKAQCSQGKIEFQGEYEAAVPEYAAHTAEDFLNFERYVQSTVYGIIFVIGAVGNITVMIIMACNKRMRTIPNAYIFNLAVGDLFSLLINLPLHHIMRLSDFKLLEGIMCHLGAFFLPMSIGVSGFSVVVLSIQRYCATSGSLHLSTRRATIFTLVAVWFAASFCALPSAFSVRVDTICSYFYKLEYYKITLVFNLFVFCIIPLSVIVFMYAMTARNLVRRVHSSQDEIKRCKTLAKIVIGLAVVFSVSFLPYHVLIVIFVWKDPMFELSTAYVIFISTCLLALNPCLNPISLCCTSVTFKKLFKHYLLCCCRRRPAQDVEDSDLPPCQEASVHYRRDFSTEALTL